MEEAEEAKEPVMTNQEAIELLGENDGSQGQKADSE